MLLYRSGNGKDGLDMFIIATYFFITAWLFLKLKERVQICARREGAAGPLL